MMGVSAPWKFELDPSLVATQPPEARGLRRDEVRLLTATADGLESGPFSGLQDHLRSGDLVIVNTSPTMAAALAGSVDGFPLTVHFSQRHDDGTWTVELRRPDRSGPIVDRTAGDVVSLPSGSITLLGSADRGQNDAVRLWRADVSVVGGLRRLMRRHGAPIRYGYVDEAWPLSSYQTVFADLCQWPASAEMASAARPFSDELVAALDSMGVRFAQINLDAGVSSLEVHEAPPAEPFRVSQRTATAVNEAKRHGNRVIAVGTTVTRALESAVNGDGSVGPRSGWTSLVLGPDRPTQVIDGLITGWHPPEASHLRLLEALAGSDLVSSAYERAVEERYLWHEFGDSCLLIP